MQHIIDNVYGVMKFFQYMNFYLIDTGAGYLIIDTGIGASSVKAIEKGLRIFNSQLTDIKAILITHCHGDHTGGLPALQKRLPDVPTYAHKLDAPYIREEKPAVYASKDELGFFNRAMLNLMPKTYPTGRVDVEVEDGDVLDDLLPGLTVVHLPGHSYGQVGYWLPESRVLIGGDVMSSMPFGLRMPLRAPSTEWETAKESIRKVAEMNVRVLCVGHGSPVMGNADIAVEKLVKRIE